MTSRRGRLASSLDSALAELGHPRTVTCCVPDFLTGLHLAGTTDLVAVAPARLVARFATRHGPVGAGELGRELVQVRVSGQRQCRQPEPRRPALGPLM